MSRRSPVVVEREPIARRQSCGQAAVEEVGSINAPDHLVALAAAAAVARHHTQFVLVDTQPAAVAKQVVLTNNRFACAGVEVVEVEQSHLESGQVDHMARALYG
jgi:hypothetical protein